MQVWCYPLFANKLQSFDAPPCESHTLVDGKLALALLDMLIELKKPCISKTVLNATISVCCISFLPKDALRVYDLMVKVNHKT